MQTISLKMNDAMLKEIDKKLKKNLFSTRTEFIRDAIRKQLSDSDIERMIAEVNKVRGSSKHKTTDAQLHKAGEKAFAKLEKRFR